MACLQISNLAYCSVGAKNGFVTVVRTKSSASSTSTASAQQSNGSWLGQDPPSDHSELSLSLIRLAAFFLCVAVVAIVLLTCTYIATFPDRHAFWNAVLRKFRFKRRRNSESAWEYHNVQHLPTSSANGVPRMSSDCTFLTQSPSAISSAVATPETASFPPKSPWLSSGITRR